MKRAPRIALVAASLISLTVAMRAAAQSALYEVPYKGPRQIRDLIEQGLEVVARTGNNVLHVAATPAQRGALYAHGASPRLLHAAGVEGAETISAFSGDYANYRTYTDVVSVLNGLAATYPTLASVSTIGQSIEGRDIPIIKISDNVASDEDEPEVLIMGCHHARELMSVEQPLQFAEYLLTNYGFDADVDAMVNGREIWIAPCVNPDGYVYVENNHPPQWWTWWRKNRRDNGDGTFGVDLNRNYGYQWGVDDIGSSGDTSSNVYRGPAPFSEPETQAVRDFVDGREFVVWLSYHSYGNLFLYPWAYYAGYTTHHAIYKEMGERMTAANGYFPGNAAMGAIYLVNGGSDDWGWGDDTNHAPVLAFTPEVGTSAEGGFGPPDSLIGPYFDALLPMNMMALELAGNPAGVLGPTPPTLLSAGGTALGELVLSWTDNVPGDANPAVSYEIEYIRDPGFAPSVDAETASPYVSLLGGFVTSSARSQEGSNSYYSGSAHNLSATLATVAPWRVTSGNDELSAWLWYNIELDWDYAFVEVSTDQGLTWQTIPGNVTTDENPNGNNGGHGITGVSGGMSSPVWVQGTFSLSDYMGQEIMLRVRYSTDGAVLGNNLPDPEDEDGLYVDLLGPVPSFADIGILASGIAGTSHTFVPSTNDPHQYRVRGTDADGDLGDWSPLLQVDDPTSARIVPPAHSSLGRIFPNPFNPTTAIPYTIGAQRGGAPRSVELAVYDVHGRHIKTLASGLLPPGQYRAVWDGTAQDGSRVGTGAYFARLSVDAVALEARKLVLVK